MGLGPRHAAVGTVDGRALRARDRRRGRATCSTSGWSAPRCSTGRVGSRGLDGGLMCTASHNPKAYTGAKLVKRGRARAVGRLGHRRAARARDRRRARRAGGASPARSSTPTSREAFREAALGYIDAVAVEPDEGGARRRQRHGRPDGRARCSTVVPARADRRPTGSRTASSPTTSPTRCCEENRRFIIDKVARRGRRPRHRLGRRRRPLLLHRRHRRVRGRRLPHRAARRGAPAQGARRHDPLRRARLARRARRGRARRRHGRWSTASATPSSRRACARRAPRSAARSPATTTSATSTAPTRARSRRC